MPSGLITVSDPEELLVASAATVHSDPEDCPVASVPTTYFDPEQCFSDSGNWKNPEILVRTMIELSV